MSNLILSGKNDIEQLNKLCKAYNNTFLSNSYSETNVGDIYYSFVLFHQYLKNIHSFKEIHTNYKHIHSLPVQLYNIILDIACEKKLSFFTSNYNTLYNNLMALMPSQQKQ